jgi:hypothetical protein
MQSPYGLIAEMYLTDALLNGAGYANYFLRDEARLKELLESMAGIEERLEGHQAPGLESPCDSSCYACLRDYSNSRLHPLLDWRLAVDMARILRTGDWSPVIRDEFAAGVAMGVAEDIPHATYEEVGGRPALVGDGATVIITHPLEDVSSAGRGEHLAYAMASADRAKDVHVLSWFRLLRSPGDVVNKLRPG